MKPILLGTLFFCFGLFAHAQTPAQQLEQMGITLPQISAPVANYVKYVRTGNLVFLAGHGHCGEPQPGDRGKLGYDLTVAQGYQAARRVGICLLASLSHALDGDLTKVKRIVKVTGMVNATPEFTDHSKVINGCSDFLVEVFGEKGKHARAAVGMASLPGNLATEIEMIVEVAED